MITRAKSKATALDEKNIEADLQRIKSPSKETGLAVAISYIRYQLCDLRNTLDTCLIAINQVFERGILRYPTFNLNAWDEEDIEIVLSDYILERDGKLAESTQASIVQSFRRVITYCKKFHIFHKIELPNIESHGVVLTRRNHVVGLREFD